VSSVARVSAPAFARTAARHVPAELAAALEPVLTLVSTLTQQIRTIERTLDGVAARYPETQRLRQVGSVGPH
jgi:hypothetical protein